MFGRKLYDCHCDPLLREAAYSTSGASANSPALTRYDGTISNEARPEAATDGGSEAQFPRNSSDTLAPPECGSSMVIIDSMRTPANDVLSWPALTGMVLSPRSDQSAADIVDVVRSTGGPGPPETAPQVL